MSSYIDVDSSKYTLGDVDYDIPEVEPPFRHNRDVFSWQASALWTPVEWMMLNGQYMFEQNDSRGVSIWSAGMVLICGRRSCR